MDLEKELKTCIDLCYESGTIALKYCNNRKDNNLLHIEIKTDESPFTIADKELNTLITTTLEKEFPKYRVIGEESTNTIETDLGEGFVFYVDPIDGTKEFISNNGEWSIIIGLAFNGRSVLGVVYHATLDRLYYAVDGKGAFLIPKKNEKPIKINCNEIDDPKQCNFVKSRSHSLNNEVEFVEKLGIKSGYAHGSFGLKCAQIGEGKADVYVNFSGKTSYWDCCGSSVILKESGGTGVLIHETYEELFYKGFSTNVKYPIICTTSKILKLLSKI